MSETANVLDLSIESESQNFQKIQELITCANQVIVDKENVIKLSIACLLANGHLLIEDRPGVGKTSLVKVLSTLFGLQNQRIQFTNDMLPADILGTSVFNQESQKFEFHKGPIFANFVLADEINRATPKTQSACLQAMEEHQIHIDGRTYALPTPFFLIATQNPQDNVGTFALPESQMDRFLMRIQMGFPSREAERELIVGRDRSDWIKELPQLFDSDKLLRIMSSVQKVFLSEVILDYLQDLVQKSRVLSSGLSPRATLDLSRAAKAWAYLEGRSFVIPEDVQAVAIAAMNHRITSEDSSSQSGYDLAREIVQSVAVP